MNWQERALKALESSLIPVPIELNEIDWKSGLSPKTERLAQHICAFANLKGGGFLAYGINNDASFHSLSKEETDETIRTLGNIAHNNLSYPIAIEHDVIAYNHTPILFIYIPEQYEKPVFLRGHDIYNSYIRSAGQTVKMSRSQVKSLIAESQGYPFEKRIAKRCVTTDALLSLLEYHKIYELQGRYVPHEPSLIAYHLANYGYCIENNSGWDIANLGAILFAKDLRQFEFLSNKKIILRKYIGTNNRELLTEQRITQGFAIIFENLVDLITKLTSIEKIEVLREEAPTYPRRAIREFLANSLIHQDFGIEGMDVTIEIFTNRIVITNPGAPLNDINRLIDLPPISRNEILAESMFLLRLCEKRGSGIDRAIEAIEKAGLPPVKFTKSESATRVFLFPKKNFKEMTKQEKISACYQHACLMYEDHQAINNQSLRERFNLDKNNSSVASRILNDTLQSGLIKQEDELVTSKKFTTYIPYYG